MKLTKTMRDAFVNQVMNDVPRVDYIEQARALVLKTVEDMLPPKVLAVWKDPQLNHFINTDWNFYYGITVTCPGRTAWELPEHVDQELQRLVAANEAQTAKLDELRASIRAVAYSVTTTEKLRAVLPEFEKYIPTKPEKATNLPALANIVAKFIEAGWPKSNV